METTTRNNTRADRRSKISPPEYSGLGKLPPQAVDLEEAVLGALMLEKDALMTMVHILRPEVFYKDSHQRIFARIKTLFEKSQPVDILTVTAALRQAGELEIVGGAYYITELTNRVASAANIEFHSRIIIQKFAQRELIRLSSETIYKAYEETSDVFEIQSTLIKELVEIVNFNSSRGFINVSDKLAECVDELKQTDSGPITGIAAGLECLDKITAGWQNSDLIILGARPSMGKTALMLHFAREAAIYQGMPIGIFSLEMNSKQLIQRFISAEGNISMNDIKFRNIRDDDFSRLWNDINGLANAIILIDDTPGIKINELRAKAIKMKAENNIKILFIDYLGLIQTAEKNKNSNRTNDVGEVSRALKGLAKELDIPIISACQLSRDVESRTSKIPDLRDLRDSGEIEQDADMVLFLYRPEYYGLTEDENGSTENVAYLSIAKHRNGEPGFPRFFFEPEFMRFSDHFTKAADPF